MGETLRKNAARLHDDDLEVGLPVFLVADIAAVDGD
jgi:hypothetical protein